MAVFIVFLGFCINRLRQFFPTIPMYAEMPAQAVPGREKTRREGVLKSLAEYKPGFFERVYIKIG